MDTYTAVFRWEAPHWVAKVEEVPLAHTSGTTLPKTQEHLRNTLAVVLDLNVDDFELVSRIHLS